MVFPVPFVAVESAVQRKSYTNSNAYFAKLFRHYISSTPLFLLKTLTKKFWFLMEVTLIILQSLLRRVFNGDVFTTPIFISKMIYEVTLVSPSAV